MKSLDACRHDWPPHSIFTLPKDIRRCRSDLLRFSRQTARPTSRGSRHVRRCRRQSDFGRGNLRLTGYPCWGLLLRRVDRERSPLARLEASYLSRSRPARWIASAVLAPSSLAKASGCRIVLGYALADPQDLVLHDGVGSSLQPYDHVRFDGSAIVGRGPVRAPIAPERRGEVADLLFASRDPQGHGDFDAGLLQPLACGLWLPGFPARQQGIAGDAASSTSREPAGKGVLGRAPQRLGHGNHKCADLAPRERCRGATAQSRWT